MTYSLCLSYINARHFKSPIDIWGNFVPGMIFFQSIFGYLVFTIIFKWSFDWKGTEGPPGLLNMLIYMFLSPGTIEGHLYKGQKFVQIFLLLLAVTCVPILLLLKPLYLRWEHNRARALGYRGIGESTRVSALDGDDEDEGSGNGTAGGRESFNTDEGVALITEEINGEEHEEFEFSDVMIHQVIHTIGVFILNSSVPRLFPFANSFYRILPQLCLAHSLLSPALGALSCPSAALNRSLDHDTWNSIQVYWQRRRHHDSSVVLPMVQSDDRNPMCHGRYQCHAA